MDIVDKAQELEQRARFSGVGRIRAGLLADGTVDCVDCAEEIPEDRKKAMPNARRCSTCQEKHERRGRR
ncbi:TraR/DksA C4-type zinc finger protein [Aestuariivirga sp. YIM B02566]|uniref:TraR/DksA C4-type zinc finger protein n=1 Tax=Taklimakanibacter albus TaxID=2800327 RepID=A0ACC5R6N7_9HYPH|nr:TraR/DksA C4-type zinc finger protein [Aestuariivirga sp. YIM B02566]MBK1868270.1 TraR/DksA C4-type zinc finger protein [Aestuariivirga sp. YIM B02566]